MNNNPQHTNPSLHHQHSSIIDRIHPHQRSSLKDIYSARKSQTLANGEDYSTVVLNNYSDPFSLKHPQENRVASSIYGSGRKSIKNVFKVNSSKDSGSMTSLLSGLNSPVLGSSNHIPRNRRINAPIKPNVGMVTDSTNSNSESKLLHGTRPDRFSLDINPSINTTSNLIDGMSQAFNNTVDGNLSNLSQQYLSPYMETNISSAASQGMLRPLFFEVPQRDILKPNMSNFVGR